MIRETGVGATVLRATRELWHRFDTGFSGSVISMFRPSVVAATLMTAAALRLRTYHEWREQLVC